jgi:YD repeat-containing protein
MRTVIAIALLLATPAMAQQRTIYGADGKVTARAATDTQGTTTIYDAAGRVTARISGPAQGRPPVTGKPSSAR